MNQQQNKTIEVLDWGFISYQEAWNRQKALHEQLCQHKLARRNGLTDRPLPNYLILCEHPPVITLGKNGKKENLKVSKEYLAARGIDFFHIERGGDVTFHGPGQLVGYPILDLENFFTDLHKYLRTLELSIIQTLADVGIQADVLPGLTGVWLDPQGENPRKIAAIGIKCSRWVTLHGFAFNISTNMDYFNLIVPCNIPDKAVTSLHAEGKTDSTISNIQPRILNHLAHAFGWTYGPQIAPYSPQIHG
jgi:lipoyl(octanoyl) transferase